MAMKTYTLDELTDEAIGKIGTPKRDKFEADLKEELQAYHIGEVIKQAQQAKNLSIMVQIASFQEIPSLLYQHSDVP